LNLPGRREVSCLHRRATPRPVRLQPQSLAKSHRREDVLRPCRHRGPVTRPCPVRASAPSPWRHPALARRRETTPAVHRQTS
jgi:hypothetical protein